MAKTRTAAALIAALLLAGCAGANTVDSPSQTTTPAQTATVNATAPATAGNTDYPDADETAFTSNIAERWSNGMSPDAEQALQLGYEACDRFDSQGRSAMTEKLWSELSKADDFLIQSNAGTYLCPSA